MILLLPVLLIIHIFLLSKLTFTAWPEMLSYPYLFAHGFSLYKDYIMPYPPGLVILLSEVFQVFGFSVENLRALTWILILAEDLILYLILKRLMGQTKVMTLMFLGIFILLQSFLDGNMLWFDLATVIPLLISFWFGLKWLENFRLSNLFWIGFFLGMAILIKQTSGVYLVGFLSFLGILRVREIRVIRALGAIGGGIFALLLPLVIYLFSTGSFREFLNWVLLYPLTEWSKFPGYVDFSISKREIVITILAFLPISVGFLQIKKLLVDKIFLLTGVFLIAALVAVYPRFSFFHLQPAIPFAVIVIAKIFSNLGQWKIAYGVTIGIMIVLVVSLLIPINLKDGIRFYQEDDIKLATSIKKITGEGEKVFLLGLNSSEYVFAGRVPPKNWSDNFGWYLEIPGVQDWVIKGFGKSLPEKVFWRRPSIGSWYSLGVYQPKKITDYITQNYHFTDKIEGGIEIWTKNN